MLLWVTAFAQLGVMHWTTFFLVCWWCFSLLQQSTYGVCAWVSSPTASRSSFFLSRRRSCSLTFGRPQSSCRHHKPTNPPDDGRAGDGKLDLRILLIDHYDSFTYNLADLVGQLCVRPPTVLAADCCDSWDELLARRHNQITSSPPCWDGIILSPGPGHPCDAVTALSRDCVRQNQQLPILGVCLGHQILGLVYGATVDLAPLPVHGQVRELMLLNNTDNSTCKGNQLWKGILPHNIQATRYHSLHVTDLDNAPFLRPTALTEDKEEILMAMEHVQYPHFGVQFHPESVGTNVGKSLLRNFVQVCEEYKRRREKLERVRRETDRGVPVNEEQTTIDSLSSSTKLSSSSSELSVYVHKISDLPQNGANLHPSDIMNDLLAEEDYSFWLDEARANGQPTVSILGASRHRVQYWGKEKAPKHQGLFVWNDENVLVESTREMDILTYLQNQHQQPTESVCMITLGDANEVLVESRWEETVLDSLPFQFRGGYVGYLGYEVRHDTARFIEEEESGRYHETAQNVTNRRHFPSDRTIPTAAFLWVERSFVYDNRNGDWYLIGVVSGNQKHNRSSREETFGWIRSMAAYFRRGKHRLGGDLRMPKSNTGKVPVFTPNRSRATYNRNFEECIEQIRQGESYELCLTNQLEALVKIPGSSPLALYNILRRQNPAPHSAFFNWNARKRNDSSSSASVAICCSSPERFVSVKRHRNEDVLSSVELQVEAKPIKGTIARVLPSKTQAVLTKEEQAEDDARAQRLQSSVKDRAENLMIVDLLRNDLSRVCQTGSVHVAKLMEIESFATVHQMVSTIRGTLDTGCDAVDVLKACFPGGSMTGAPKIRTMELLDKMEEGASRGPYSGCLGYISLNGSMDMNIIIRTAVLTPTEHGDEWNVRVGAGGAITALSESSDEYEEMMLKASAVLGAVKEWALVSGKPNKSLAIAKADSTRIALDRLNTTDVRLE